MAIMKPLHRLFIVACICLGATAVTLPSTDPFYIPPKNLTSYRPGDVIRSRSIPPSLNGISGKPLTRLLVKAAYQYLYRTTNDNSKAAAAVTTLLVPNNADPSKLLAYQTAYDSANNDCSPSYALQSGANTSATLKQAPASGLSPSARYVMWGYSGGSIACEWVAELQSSYAPELKFAGVALGRLIPDVQNVLNTINRGPFAGLAFSGITGLSKAYPQLGTFVQNNLVPSKFNQIGSGCLSQASEAGFFKGVYSYFTDGEATFYQDLPQQVLARTGIMGTHGTPKSPLFVYKAVADEVSPGTDTDALVKKLCSQDAIIEYHIDLVGDHITEAITGSASALAWVSDRLSGIPVPNAICTTLVVALTSLSLDTLEELGLMWLPS